ncbi:transcriptional regulator, TetR family [Paenibacillus uliginis N3/975]|uniref:Transcriptional regulator, TetR family n=1 Tax=Paenibacillus uliginis N3/975 TaxID=1313296 RepID=A0A1X7GH18_9BACL|nr:TetR/AcrR family transcriptional regulator [Paenibacillus uliginis]SMF69733.1 transcriptional regulator, TetR family [Paenibacillus uliginis N3/975]
MNEEVIKEIAMKHFILYGYEGTKLAKIAEEAGIKKQSLYHYFKNKDELVLKMNEEAIEEEIEFLKRYFREKSTKPLNEILVTFLIDYKKRYLSNDNLSFMLLMAFMPPAHLCQVFQPSCRNYYSHLELLLERIFIEHKDVIRVSPEDAAVSFVMFMDGVVVQLFYETPEAFDKVLRISWDIYWRGLSCG